MKKRVLIAVLWMLVTAGAVMAQTDDLPRTSPEAVGIRSAQVSAFFDSLLAYPKTEIHSVIVMRHGRVVGEMYPAPFRAEYPLTQFSCSKTFVAAAVGIAIGENLLRLNDRLVTFFPEHLPKVVSWRLASITVEDLLTMRSGFVVDREMRTRSLHWIRDYLAHPMNADPGRRFQYDSIDTYLLSAIVQRVTGMTVLEYLRQKVFRQLNINEVKWELSPEGIVTGGWGLYVQSESLAKFGQLLLQRGRWHGEQLIPAGWVDTMMKRHVAVNDKDGYGYQMWQCAYPTAMSANGAYGQYIIVVPKKDMVIVITQCSLNNGKVEQSFIWKTLFDGMRERPFEASPDWQQLLQREYTLPLLEGAPTSKLLAGCQGRYFCLDRNALGWSGLRVEADSLLEITDTAGRRSLIELGYQTWKTTAVNAYPLNARYEVKNQFSTIKPPFHIGACYAWRDDELTVKLHYVDWMASVQLNISFEEDRLRMVAQENYKDKPVVVTGSIKTEQ